MNILYFNEIFSRKEIEKLSNNYEKIYKLLLVELLHNIILGKDNHEYFLPIYEYLKDLKQGCYTDEDCKKKIEEIKPKIENEVRFTLTDEIIEEYIKFGRKRFCEIKKYGLSIFQKWEIEKIYPNLFKNNIREDWLALDINVGIGFINPVLIAFNDLRVNWNDYIYLKEEIDKQFLDCNFASDIDDYYNDVNVKRLHYRYGATMRQLIFLVVTIVESYLFNSVMHIPKIEIDEHNLNKIACNDKLQDTNIIENILFVIQPELKQMIEKNYLIYKDINKIRNKYVHLSTRIDRSNNKYPQILHVITLDKMNIPNLINECFKLILIINDEFFKKRDIDLLNWYKYRDFDFSSMKEIPLA